MQNNRQPPPPPGGSSTNAAATTFRPPVTQNIQPSSLAASKARLVGYNPNALPTASTSSNSSSANINSRGSLNSISNSAAPPPTAAVSDKEINRIVAEHLRKRGYKRAFEAFKDEAKLPANQSIESMALELGIDSHTHLMNSIRSYNRSETSPEWYQESYTYLRRWIDQSLDMYKHELHAILFPIFVHFFLDLVEKDFDIDAVRFMQKNIKEHERAHKDELTDLQKVSKKYHIKDNHAAQLYRQHKSDIQLSCYSHQLLISFIENAKLMLLLKVINEHINLTVVSGRPLQKDSQFHYSLYALTELTKDERKDLNKQKIKWGALPQVAHAENDVSMSNSFDAQNQRPPPPRSAPGSVDPLPDFTERDKEKLMYDLKRRVILDSERHPSCCFYTFLNSEKCITNVHTSDDGRLVAAGTTQSVVKLWDLRDDPNEIDNDKIEDEEDSIDYDSSRKRSKSGSYCLIGHSGPVYANSFSTDNKWLLSGSEDGTVRLWQTEMKHNLVCYRGHNYPIWDVQFSPVNFYFVSTSLDKTARLWNTERIYPLRIFAGHLSDVDCAKFHPNCNYIGTGSTDKTFRLWDIQTGECVRLFIGHTSKINAIAFAPDGKHVATAGDDKIMVWDLDKEDKPLYTFSGHTRPISCLDYSGHGSTLLASGSLDYSVRLWDVKKGSSNPVREYYTKTTPVTYVKFTPQNLLLAGGVFRDGVDSVME